MPVGHRRFPLLPPLGLLLTAFGISLGPPEAVTAQDVTLRWQLQQGNEYVYRMTNTSRTETPNGPVTQNQIQTLRYTVLSVEDDGTTRLRITTDRLRTVVESPMGTQEFDSEEPDDAPAGLPALGAIVGQAFELEMAADGRVVAVSGLQEMMDHIVGQMSEGQPGMASQMRQMVEGMFGEEGMESTMQQGFQILPSESVAPGAQWEFSFTQPMGFGTVSAGYQYVLEDITESEGSRIAHIVLDGTIGDFQADEQNPMAGNVDVSGGSLTGEIAFDVDQGLLTHSEVSTTLDMNATGQVVSTESTVEMELMEVRGG